MVIFLDTSSLVKLYYKEADSEAFINKILEDVETFVTDDILLRELFGKEGLRTDF